MEIKRVAIRLFEMFEIKENQKSFSSLYIYIANLVLESKISNKILTNALIYLERFELNTKSQNVVIDDIHILFRIFLAAIVVASKWENGAIYDNVFWAQRSLFYNPDDIKIYENNFLKNINYNVWIH